MAKIVVIDDDPVICAVILEILISVGHNAEVFSSAVEGIRAYAKDKPHLVITGILMPDNDGFEVLREIRSRDQKTPILALSSGQRVLKPAFIFPSPELVGASHSLSKPFTRTHLLDAVKHCLTL